MEIRAVTCREEELLTIIEHYGERNQVKKAIEELDELKERLEIYECSIDDYDTPELVVEEMADVMIMVYQIMIIMDVDPNELQSFIDYKLARTFLRMRQEKKDEEDK